MNLKDPDDRNLAAAEYVLGTLAGEDLVAFELALAGENGLRAIVARWEHRLGEVSAMLPVQEPPPELWERIDLSLDDRPRPSPAVGSPTPTPRTTNPGPGVSLETIVAGWRRRVAAWRIATGVATTVALGALAFIYLQRPEQVGQVTPLIAVLKPADSGAVWLVSAQTGQTVIRPISQPQLAPGRSFELWAVPANGTPVSLGLLDPQGPTVLKLPPERLARVAPGETLAVSIEPAGGSPTGQPTGPVVYTGRLAKG